MTHRIFIYVEDPGSANFAAPLVDALASEKIECCCFAAKHAASMLPRWRDPKGCDAAALLEREGATALIVGIGESHDSFAHRLVDAAHDKGVPSIALIDSSANASHRFSGGDATTPLRHAPDWLLVADQGARSRFVALGHPEDRILPVGSPHFDIVRRQAHDIIRKDRNALRQHILPARNSDRPVVTFLAEINAGLNPEGYHRTLDYTLPGRGDRDDRTGIVMQEVLDACAKIDPRPWMVLRPHPKNQLADFAGLENEFDAICQEMPILELLACSDLVVGMTSMPLIEAALMGRPVLSVLPRAKEASWLAITDLGLIPIATNRNNLVPAIRQTLASTAQLNQAAIDAAFPRNAAARSVAAMHAILIAGN